MNARNYGCQNKHGRQYVRRTGVQPKQGGQRGSKGAFFQQNAVERGREFLYRRVYAQL